tara:strand:+ start:17684 stop:18592 length:909 start_codon:yes stop_codon:yes gene_type:complete
MLYIGGWCGTIEEKEVTDIRLLANDVEVGGAKYGIKREDVKQFYNSDLMLFTGFYIDIHLNEENLLTDKSTKVKLQCKIENEIWVDLKELTDKEKEGFEKLDLSSVTINSQLKREAVVIDNFYSDPMKVRELALRTDMIQHEDYHKGNRTDETYIAEGTKEAFENLLGKEITKWDYGTNGCFQFCTAEDKVVYHTDGQQWAGAVYLTPDAPVGCGTSFYKSKINGWRKEPSEKEVDDPMIIHSEIFAGGFYDRNNFELVDTVGNVFNRLVLWDAKLIHSATEYFGSNRENSRLFHLFFFDAK